MKNPLSGRRALLAGAVMTLLGIALLGTGGIVAWEYTNSNEFCANVCHQVHPEETLAFERSLHARIQCVECHVGRLPTLQTMWAKTEHAHELWGMIVGYERPLRSTTLRPAAEACELCHWPESFHADSLHVNKHYAADRDNTETHIHLLLHTSGGTSREGRGRGIHWHIENELLFIATDPFNQNIPWVQVTFQDGRTVTYTDVSQPLSAAEVAVAEKHRMDCVDCHNRVGHPFPNPADEIDKAFALGQVDSRLRFIKRWILDVLEQAQETDRSTSKLVAEALKEYRSEFPGVALERSQAVEQAGRFAYELIMRTRFTATGIDWRSFPDNSGHRDFPGCFRCHDGKHLSAEGDSIRLHCNICHTIPTVQEEGEPLPPIQVRRDRQPEFHFAPGFMAEHRIVADASCGGCHGEIEFGTNDEQGFCSNAACHGVNWTNLELDPLPGQPHALIEAHASVPCHECHQGRRAPPDVCEACHGDTAPDKHFQENCSDCHQSTGWATSGRTVRNAAPEIPHEIYSSTRCTECHSMTGQLARPASHMEYTADHCRLCHS